MLVLTPGSFSGLGSTPPTLKSAWRFIGQTALSAPLDWRSPLHQAAANPWVSATEAGVAATAPVFRQLLCAGDLARCGLGAAGVQAGSHCGSRCAPPASTASLPRDLATPAAKPLGFRTRPFHLHGLGIGATLRGVCMPSPARALAPRSRNNAGPADVTLRDTFERSSAGE